MSDVRRAISRFHVTVNVEGVSAEEKLVEKARAYLLSDANTPVLGDFCRAVISKAEGVRVPACIVGKLKYRSTVDDPQYPNMPDNTWMDFLAEQQLAVNKFNRHRFDQWLARVGNLQDIINRKEPLAEPTGVKTPTRAIVVDDVRVDPAPRRQGRQRGKRGRSKA
jgi:hypothetical protein